MNFAKINQLQIHLQVYHVFILILFQSRKRIRLKERRKMAHYRQTEKRRCMLVSLPELEILRPENWNGRIPLLLENSQEDCCVTTVNTVSCLMYLVNALFELISSRSLC